MSDGEAFGATTKAMEAAVTESYAAGKKESKKFAKKTVAQSDAVENEAELELIWSMT